MDKKEETKKQLKKMIEIIDKKQPIRKQLKEKEKQLKKIKSIITKRLKIIKIINILTEILDLNNENSMLYKRYEQELIRLKKECEDSIIDIIIQHSDTYASSLFEITNSDEFFEEREKKK